MARPLRIEFAGALYHVTSRGDQHEAIYFSDRDRLTWLAIFADVCQRYHWRCHAWCQMTNHYHIVIETLAPTLSVGMRHLNGVFTQYINRTHQRVGHVFQGRYKAILVEQDSYLLEVARYVVLNPVRAGMVRQPEQWYWSSYASMMTPEFAPDWLETRCLLSQFSSDERKRQLAYQNFIGAGIGLPPIWGQIKGQIFLGSEEFVLRLQDRIGVKAEASEVPHAQRRPAAMPLSYYMETIADRNLAMTTAYASGHYSQRQLAQAFGVHYSTVSRILSQGGDA